jgi:molybdopterin converting factor small subunit
MGVPISFSPTLPRVVAGISAGTTVLALAGVVTATVLIFTASFAVLWPLLIGCACVAAIGLVIFAVAIAIAGFQAWYRKAPAQENEVKEERSEIEKTIITSLNASLEKEKQKEDEDNTTNILEVTSSDGREFDQSPTTLHDSDELNLLNANLNTSQNVALGDPALVFVVGQLDGGKVIQITPSVLTHLQESNETAYLELALTLTANDAFLSTLQSGDSLYMRGNFCGLSWDKDVKIDLDWKKNICLMFHGNFIINKENFLCNGKGVPCQWKFLKNDSEWEKGPNRTLKLRNPMDE